MERETVPSLLPSAEAASRLPSQPVPLFAVPDDLAEFNAMYGTE